MSRWPKEIQGLAYSGKSAAQQGFHELVVDCLTDVDVSHGRRAKFFKVILGKLKKYVGSGSIRIDRGVEKDDNIDAIVAARGECLVLGALAMMFAHVGIFIVESNFLILYRIIIGDTLFLKQLQDGPEDFSLGRDKVRVPRAQHSNFLVQI